MKAVPVPPPASDEKAARKIEYHRKLRELEQESIALYPEESITLSVLRKNHEPVRFFDGFATCRAWGRTLSFSTPAQRWICEVLWSPWQGSSEFLVQMPTDTVLEKAGLSPDGQIEKYFTHRKTNRKNEAYGFLIHVDNGIVWMGPPPLANVADFAVESNRDRKPVQKTARKTRRK